MILLGARSPHESARRTTELEGAFRVIAFHTDGSGLRILRRGFETGGPTRLSRRAAIGVWLLLSLLGWTLVLGGLWLSL